MKCSKLIQFHFYIQDFNLFSCELDSFTFKVLYWVILYQYYIKTKSNHHTFTASFEKSKTVYFASSIMKNICVLRARSRFPVKLICCIAFGSASKF